MVGDNRPVPDMLNEFLTAEYLSGMLRKKMQQVNKTRLGRDLPILAIQLILINAQNPVIDLKTDSNHRIALCIRKIASVRGRICSSTTHR
ncbi:Uncharacterised protein [Vibrio cholerae]|uniref:Uncharacterized protein n=1 Tax=Vibrio cholerae TaxID=666 RepID=A0A655ZIB0_VIBCL|nr:Uncharacterised protein [Vibrio cholerae]CSC69192.1 Uncharacterised protein [Vibrio cholerae]CSC73353.1 Uncharacterised protein [Vibrio cholerae]